MSNYKLVPIGPTPEMVSAAEDAYMPFGDMELAIRMALLAAPTVQGEPVAWMTHHDEPMLFLAEKEAAAYCDDDESPIPLYAAPQPAEQQPAPDVEALVEALSIARDYVFSSLEEKKLALAGYPQMWRCEQDDLAMIDATLAAYCKETNHDK